MSVNTNFITEFSSIADFQQNVPHYNHDDSGFPYIERAIKVNNLSLVTFFYEKAPELINRPIRLGKKFIGMAIETAALRMVEKLIMLGADVNVNCWSSWKNGTFFTNLICQTLGREASDHYGTAGMTRLLLFYGCSLEPWNTWLECHWDLRMQSIFKHAFESLFKDTITFKQELMTHSPLGGKLAQIITGYFWEPPLYYQNYLGNAETSTLASCIHKKTTPKDFEEMRSLLPIHQLTDKDAEGNTILYHAVVKNNPFLIEYILEKIPIHQLTDEDARGNTILYHAVVKNNPFLIEYILEKVPQLIDKNPERGPSLLSSAIQSCVYHPEEGIRIPKLLINLRANVHTPSLSFRGTKVESLFLTALASDMQAATPITTTDLAARSCTFLLLQHECPVDLTDTFQLAHDIMFQAGLNLVSSSGYGIKWEQTHVFLKKVFKKLGREFVRERTSLLFALETQLFLIPKDTHRLIVDYVLTENWSHIPGADTYLK